MTGPRPDFLETLRQMAGMAQKPDATRQLPQDWLSKLHSSQNADALDGLAGSAGEFAKGMIDPASWMNTLNHMVNPAQMLVDAKEGMQDAYQERNPLKQFGKTALSMAALLPIVGPEAKIGKTLLRGAEGAAAKLAAEVPAGQSGMFGALERLGAPQQGPLVQAGRGVPVHETPAFKNWFGKSKVVDEAGKPRVAYHATPHDFDTFKVGGTVDDKGLYQSGPAIWAGFDRDTYRAAHNVGGFIGADGAAVYKPGTNVMPLHAKVENPLIVTPQNHGSIKDELELSGAFPLLLSHQDVAKLKKRGHDGIFTRLWGPAEEEVVVFDNTQLKSAIGNRGTFDPKDPRITYGILGALGLGAATKKKKGNETR